MLLEDQKVTGNDAEAQLDEIVRESNPCGLVPHIFWLEA